MTMTQGGKANKNGKILEVTTNKNLLAVYDLSSFIA